MAASLFNLTKFTSKNLKLRHHQLDGYEFEQAPGVGVGQGTCCATPWGLQRVGHDRVTEMNWIEFRNISTKQSSHILDTKVPVPCIHKVNVLYWNLEESSENAPIYLYICPIEEKITIYLTQNIFAMYRSLWKIILCFYSYLPYKGLVNIYQRAWYSVFKKQKVYLVNKFINK